MFASALSVVTVIAQSEGSGGSGKGDSSLLYIIVLAVLGIVAVTAALLVLRARAPQQSTSARDVSPPRDSEERGPDGRPLYRDPDPDRLAGGRARMTGPLDD